MESVNPYAHQAIARFDIGTEYAIYLGYPSESYLAKGRDGSLVFDCPKVIALPGYEFLGWSYGGTDIDIPADASRIEIDASKTDSRGRPIATMYAVYADSEGNGHCACGAYKEDAFPDHSGFHLDPAFVGISMLAASIAIVLAVGIAAIVRSVLGIRKKYPSTDAYYSKGKHGGLAEYQSEPAGLLSKGMDALGAASNGGNGNAIGDGNGNSGSGANDDGNANNGGGANVDGNGGGGRDAAGAYGAGGENDANGSTDASANGSAMGSGADAIGMAELLERQRALILHLLETEEKARRLAAAGMSRGTAGGDADGTERSGTDPWHDASGTGTGSSDTDPAGGAPSDAKSEAV